MPTKHCSWGTCNSDSRKKKQDCMKGVTFKRIQTFKQDAEKCNRWVTACGRDKVTVNDVDGNKYVCSKHFVLCWWNY